MSRSWSFAKAGRDDLVEREQAEIEILQPYLPEQLSRDEIRARAEAVIAEVGASGPRDMGKVMPKLTAEMQGNADGRGDCRRRRGVARGQIGGPAPRGTKCATVQ